MKKIILLLTLITFSNYSDAQISDSTLRKIDTLFSNVGENGPGYMISVIQKDEFLLNLYLNRYFLIQSYLYVTIFIVNFFSSLIWFIKMITSYLTFAIYSVAPLDEE